LPREQTHEQPHRRPGVAHVERLRGRAQAMQAHALHHHFARRGARDLHTQRTQCAERREAVLAVEESADAGLPLRDAAEHQGAVRHGLVAGDPQPTVHRRRRRHTP
jgi:hypothetical protein